MAPLSLSGRSLLLLFGGTSDERLVSVASAQNLSPYLEGAAHWFLSPFGAIHPCEREELLGHERPFEVSFSPRSPARWKSLDDALASGEADGAVCFLALHGGDEENGTLQAVLERRRVAFTGSGAEASAAAFDKARAKAIARGQGVPVADGAEISGADLPGARAALERLLRESPELILKPKAGGSSVGLFAMRSAADFERALAFLASRPTTPYLAERLLRGREVTVGVHVHRGHLVALPPSEVRVAAGHDFDYEGKYLGRGSVEITPAEISADETRAVQTLALRVHQAIGAFGYSRTDFILSPSGPVFLEINTLPGLTRASFIPQQLAAAGIALPEFLATQIAVAAEREKARS